MILGVSKSSREVICVKVYWRKSYSIYNTHIEVMTSGYRSNMHKGTHILGRGFVSLMFLYWECLNRIAQSYVTSIFR